MVSTKNSNSALPPNTRDQLTNRERSHSLSSILNRSNSNSSKSLTGKKVMFQETWQSVEKFKEKFDSNEKACELDKVFSKLTLNDSSNSNKGSSVQVGSQTSLLKNTMTDVNNNHVNNQSNASIVSSQNGKASENFFFVYKKSVKCLCDHCKVYYFVEEKS